jgi:hypothetical protein
MNKKQIKSNKPAEQKLKRVSINELKSIIKPISIKKQCDSVINDSQAILGRDIALKKDFNSRDLKLPFQDAKIDISILKTKY